MQDCLLMRVPPHSSRFPRPSKSCRTAVPAGCCCRCRCRYRRRLLLYAADTDAGNWKDDGLVQKEWWERGVAAISMGAA